MDIYRSHVLCCGGTGCTSSGSAKIIEAFENEIKAAGLEKEVKVLQEREILNWFKKSGLSFEEFSDKFIENENDVGNSDGEEPETDLFANLTDTSDITEADDDG